MNNATARHGAGASWQETLQNTVKSIQRGIKRLNGTPIDYNLDSYRAVVGEIRERTRSICRKSDTELTRLSTALADHCRQNDPAIQDLIEAFAIAGVVVERKLNIVPFDEQLIAGLVLNEGKLAEMQTGEGKTLAAVFPAYFNALGGQGVQVLTFNDYLAKRDALWMEPVYRSLGISVGYIEQNTPRDQRRFAYACDITYLTAKELGFDYLRDGLCYQPDERVQRACAFTVVDEADSILIDEARIPLVLASSTEARDGELGLIRQLVEQLDPSTDLCFDEHRRNVNLSEEGIQRVEAVLGLDNLYDDHSVEQLIAIGYALHAEHLLKRNVDYLVKDGQIVLVDEFTGRIADSRRWPDGLHAAVEAKENLPSQHASQVQSSISLQHLLKRCPRLCGMSATCESSAEEFHNFYGLRTVIIPPHRTSMRVDYSDRIFLNGEAKQQALADEVAEAHLSGRPVLVGTASVEESYALHSTLQARGLKAEVLNANNDAEEAQIIAQAGRLKAITISTNMAGRGTDIVLGGGDAEESRQVKLLGGLYVLGSSRYESPRIDRQLRGRAGRQGDPGASQFFISLEDPLYKRFNFKALLTSKALAALDRGESQEITTPWLRRKTQQIQRIIDGENYEIRKTLVAYSHMLDQQRELVRRQRLALLCSNGASRFFEQHAPDRFVSLKGEVSEDHLSIACRTILLWCMDQRWCEHLGSAADLQDVVRLRALGGNNPLHDFQKQVSAWFADFFDAVDEHAISTFSAVSVVNGQLDLDKAGVQLPSSTWTYQKDDSLFDDMRDQLLTQPGFSAVAALLAGPLLLLALWVTRKSRK